MIEKVILANLLYNEEFVRKIVPYVVKDYFTEHHYQIIYELIQKYVVLYNTIPSKEALLIDLLDKENISDEEKSRCDDLIVELVPDSNTNFDWLIKKTEEFCKDRAIYLAITKSLEIYEKKESLGSIPKILTEALSLSFNMSLGNDFFEDAPERWEAYHKLEDKVPFNIGIFNKITRGGVSKGTLNIFIASFGVGKTALMCSLAANNLKDGKNILYITLEMGEEKIQQRIEANLMNMTTMEVTEKLTKEQYLHQIDTIKKLTGGRLIVEQFPTKQAGVSHFRFLISELKLKQNFIPDIIYIDYMNICISVTSSKNAPLDQKVVAISEELRGLAIEFNVPIMTATQFNREGFETSDPTAGDTAQAFGINWTADLILAINRTEEMDKLGQVAITQFKNRDSEKSECLRFVIGVDISKMQFYDVPDSEQNIMGSEGARSKPFITPEMEKELSNKVNNFEDLFE